MDTEPLIAVVDDEETVRRALGRLLRAAGFEIETFESGAAFIDSLSLRLPHCVILDLHMPKLDGWAVQGLLARDHPGVPVMIVTGRDTSEARSRAEALGVRAYLRKPVDADVLVDAIHRCLETT